MDHDRAVVVGDAVEPPLRPRGRPHALQPVLDQFEYAEKLGWDGLCVNEHHQNCYGTMPSPT